MIHVCSGLNHCFTFCWQYEVLYNEDSKQVNCLRLQYSRSRRMATTVWSLVYLFLMFFFYYFCCFWVFCMIRFKNFWFRIMWRCINNKARHRSLNWGRENVKTSGMLKAFLLLMKTYKLLFFPTSKLLTIFLQVLLDSYRLWYPTVSQQSTAMSEHENG